MANNEVTSEQMTFEKKRFHDYTFALLIGGAIGSLIGYIIANELGETYIIDPDNNGSDDVNTLHHFDDSGSRNLYYTAAGRNWVGGGAGIGAAIGLLLMFLYRNFGTKQTMTNAYNPLPTSLASGPYQAPQIVN